MSYRCTIYQPDGSRVNGVLMNTLQAAVDHIEYYARGQTLRDVYINGIKLSDVGLHVLNGKVVEEDGTPLVCRNKWYDLFQSVAYLTGEEASETDRETVNGLGKFSADFDRIFRPQPTRGSAPTNPATLAAKGEV
jgi:hypothetical protein